MTDAEVLVVREARIRIDARRNAHYQWSPCSGDDKVVIVRTRPFVEIEQRTLRRLPYVLDNHIVLDKDGNEFTRM